MKLSTAAALDQFIPQLELVELDADDAAVDRFVRAYLARWNLGDRNRLTERAYVWRGVRYQGRIVAVFGERWMGDVLELTDAYQDDTPEGLAAFASTLFGYLRNAREGVYSLVHTVLYENKTMWATIVKETGDQPYALIFKHEKREG